MQKRRGRNNQTDSRILPNNGQLWQVVGHVFCYRKFMTVRNFWVCQFHQHFKITNFREKCQKYETCHLQILLLFFNSFTKRISKRGNAIVSVRFFPLCLQNRLTADVQLLTIVCRALKVKVIGQVKVMGQASAVCPTSLEGSFFSSITSIIRFC